MKVLTFDVEEWFHVLDNSSTKTENEWEGYERRLDLNIEKILKLLEEKGQKATFFSLGWVARNYPHIIRKIHEQGHELATHSDRHQLVYEQGREEFQEDLKRSIGAIGEVTGEKVRAYRSPGFSILEQNKWAFDILAESGIEIDCSIFPAQRAHGGFSSFGHARPAIIHTRNSSLKEFPINVYPVLGKSIIFSGGGYFRLIPYPLINYMARNSEYVMTYFHPRDFDPRQPVIKDLSFIRKFKSYCGLKGAFAKLQKLLDDFEMVDLRQAEQRIDWEEVDNIKLS